MATQSLDFDHHLADNTQRFLTAASDAIAADCTVLDRAVPSCPEWRLADLIWHLGEVQDFWSYILGNEGADPSTYDRDKRPGDSDLVGYLTKRLGLLQCGLERSDADACWCWSPTGGTVAWVRRRQAHEALIHRVDVELTVNNRSPIDEKLAVDGIDEVFQVMLRADSLPTWATFTPDPGTVLLDSGPRQWAVETGRLNGSNLEGQDVDDQAVRLVPFDPSTSLADTSVSGAPAALLLWLWGRADHSRLTVSGDAARVQALQSQITDTLS